MYIFKKICFLLCLEDMQFNPNPNPDSILRLKPDPNTKKIISDPQHCTTRMLHRSTCPHAYKTFEVKFQLVLTSDEKRNYVSN